MQTVSLLMFNRNENEGIIRNIKLLKDAVDEIVIVDNSDPEKYEQLKKSLKLFNIKLFRTLSLGCQEPLFYYGISKVSSEYILHLDADEEPSKELIKKIKEKNFLYNFYTILSKDEKSEPLGYKSMVLFTKSSIKEITGILHMGIEFKEKPKKFPQEAYMIHHEKETRKSINKNYMEIESYVRPIKAYINYLKKKRGFIGDLFSFTYNLPKPINVYLTAFGIGCGRSIFNIFVLQCGPSYREYTHWIPYIIRYSMGQIKYSINVMKFFSSLPKKEQELRTEIAREIQECGGVIKYLGLNKDYIMENLTKTFKWDMSGLEAFRKLLLYRHFHKKPAYKFPY